MRRKLQEPTLDPCGSSLILLKSFETNASNGFSRSKIAPISNSLGNSYGTSFIEWTAISALPSSIPTSNSLINRYLPPIFERGEFSILSPWVLIFTNSTSRSG